MGELWLGLYIIIMNRLKTLVRILFLIVIMIGCKNKKNKNVNNQKEIVESKEKIFSELEIAKYTISAIMDQPPEIITVKEKDEIYYVSYIREADKKKFDYKIKISDNRVTWGNVNGRWRETKFDEKIKHFEINNRLKIIQTFYDGSEIVKEFNKSKKEVI